VTTLVDHARRELALSGQIDEDPAYAAAVTATVAAFSSYGHSGGSAEAAVAQLVRLLNFEHLAPLTTDPDEWEDQSERSGVPMWQNRRNPRAISIDRGRTYRLVDDETGTMHVSQDMAYCKCPEGQCLCLYPMPDLAVQRGPVDYAAAAPVDVAEAVSVRRCCQEAR